MKGITTSLPILKPVEVDHKILELLVSEFCNQFLSINCYTYIHSHERCSSTVSELPVVVDNLTLHSFHQSHWSFSLVYGEWGLINCLPLSMKNRKITEESESNVEEGVHEK